MSGYNDKVFNQLFQTQRLSCIVLFGAYACFDNENVKK